MLIFAWAAAPIFCIPQVIDWFIASLLDCAPIPPNMLHLRPYILGRGFVPVPSSFAVKSLGLGVRERKIQSLGFGVRELKKL